MSVETRHSSRSVRTQRSAYAFARGARNVEPLQRDRVDGQEVAGDDSACLLAEKGAPAQLAASRRRLDLVLAQDPPDGARRDPDAKANELAVDATVAPV